MSFTLKQLLAAKFESHNVFCQAEARAKDVAAKKNNQTLSEQITASFSTRSEPKVEWGAYGLQINWTCTVPLVHASGRSIESYGNTIRLKSSYGYPVGNPSVDARYDQVVLLISDLSHHPGVDWYQLGVPQEIKRLTLPRLAVELSDELAALQTRLEELQRQYDDPFDDGPLVAMALLEMPPGTGSYERSDRGQ